MTQPEMQMAHIPCECGELIHYNLQDAVKQLTCKKCHTSYGLYELGWKKIGPYKTGEAVMCKFHHEYQNEPYYEEEDESVRSNKNVPRERHPEGPPKERPKVRRPTDLGGR